MTHTQNSTSRPRRARPLHLSVAAIAALALASCGVGESPETTEDAGAGSDDVVFRLAHVYEAANPVEACGVATLNEELDGSGMRIESYPASQLGSEAEVLEQVATGGVDMAATGAGFLGTYYEPISVLDSAYVFDDVDHFVETIEGPRMAEVYEGLNEESGIKVMDGWYYGTRHLTSNEEVDSPSDMQGLKIRTPDAAQYLLNAEVMGGTPTPMALSEVYLALQQGVIDAQENPIPTISNGTFEEVQDYINLTGHVIAGAYLVTSSGLYDGLEDEQKTALTDAMEVASVAVRECVESEEEEILEQWRQDGTITVNDDVDRDAFAEQARELLPEQVSWGDLYEEIQASR